MEDVSIDSNVWGEFYRVVIARAERCLGFIVNCLIICGCGDASISRKGLGGRRKKGPGDLRGP